MKTQLLSLTFLIVLSSGLRAEMPNESSADKPVMAMFGIDAKRIGPVDSGQIASGILVELEKLNKFQIMDKYDVEYLLRKNNFQEPACFSKICMLQAAAILKCDKLFSATVEVLGSQIIFTFKLIDVSTGTVEKTQVNKFLHLTKEIPAMIGITINNMFGITNDEALVRKLTQSDDYDSEVNNPYVLRLRTDGPRMGFTIFTGETAKRLQASRDEGGYDARSIMYQFGYQFEKQYLNEGNFQALFEFIPVITGIDQALFIPSFTFMNGLRNNTNGIEFALGPTFSFVSKAEGFYDKNGNWILKNAAPADPGTKYVTRFDSRGELYLNPAFILAFGKTFKSGRLNIPVNLFVIPARDGARYGFSFGFNAKERYMKR